ncbi:hypothetical protein ACEK07_47940, partial [Alcanivoracaceae bacterium MT1]
MPLRKGPLFATLIFTLATALLPVRSFAILLKDEGANMETSYPSFLANIRVATKDTSGDITNTTGMGAFIGPDLVVTAAHLVVPHDDTDSSGVVVTG